MGFFSKLFGRNEERAAFGGQYLSNVGSFFVGGSSDTGIKVTEDIALTASTVWACVQVIANAVSTLPVHVVKRIDGGRDYNHPVYRLFQEPNEFMTAPVFAECLMVNLLLYGNAYAARYNVLSYDLGGWKEKIVEGAFKASLSSGADVRALINHEDAKLLGRTSAATLKLSEDAKGLRYEVTLPEGVSYADDLAILVKRGDVKSNSFGFITPPGGDRFRQEGKTYVRELLNVTLREISVLLSSPAYPGTSLSLRVDPAVLKRIQRTNYTRCAGLYRTTLVKG